VQQYSTVMDGELLKPGTLFMYHVLWTDASSSPHASGVPTVWTRCCEPGLGFSVVEILIIANSEAAHQSVAHHKGLVDLLWTLNVLLDLVTTHFS
jgi:hypothetical protein